MFPTHLFNRSCHPHIYNQANPEYAPAQPKCVSNRQYVYGLSRPVKFSPPAINVLHKYRACKTRH